MFEYLSSYPYEEFRDYLSGPEFTALIKNRFVCRGQPITQDEICRRMSTLLLVKFHTNTVLRSVEEEPGKTFLAAVENCWQRIEANKKKDKIEIGYYIDAFETWMAADRPILITRIHTAVLALNTQYLTLPANDPVIPRIFAAFRGLIERLRRMDTPQNFDNFIDNNGLRHFLG